MVVICARERDDAWRQELDVQRDAAEAVQVQLQARLQAVQGSEAELREAVDALEHRCDTQERRHLKELQEAVRETAAERDAFWQQVCGSAVRCMLLTALR